MGKVIFYGAYVANIIMFIAVIAIFIEARGDQQFLAVLMFIPPVLSFFALRNGPDLEERMLARKLNKARMQAELKKLGVKD